METKGAAMSDKKCPNCGYELDSWNDCVSVNNILECPECEEHFELKAVTLNQPRHSNENEVILDPFMGSGTTAIAAINTKRNFIGFELNKEYFEIAQNRIEERQRQISLFDEI